jgi:hypothetical protein
MCVPFPYRSHNGEAFISLYFFRCASFEHHSLFSFEYIDNIFEVNTVFDIWFRFAFFFGVREEQDVIGCWKDKSAVWLTWLAMLEKGTTHS